MINLNSRPVFGYEYASCNANERRITDMIARGNLNAELGKTARISMIASNIFKVAGAFFPLVGLARILYAVVQNDEQIGKEVLRGLAELLGAGLFMIAIDVAVTIHREYQAAHPQYDLVS